MFRRHQTVAGVVSFSAKDKAPRWEREKLPDSLCQSQTGHFHERPGLDPTGKGGFFQCLHLLTSDQHFFRLPKEPTPGQRFKET